VDDGCRLVLVGSNGAVPDKEPLWFANVEAMAEVTIEVGERTLKAKPTVLREGPERDRLYALAVDYWPDLLQYETKAAFRQFPVIRLDPKE
jgi:deazaflavin-dependent oxidoreductase (nitroreductase family)